MLNNWQIIDLSHEISETIPTWPGSRNIKLTKELDYADSCKVESIHCNLGIGTHIDSPSHFIPQGRSIAELKLEELIASACVIDVCKKTIDNADYQISIADILSWEEKNQTIPAGAIILAHTGWSQFWHDETKYQNKDLQGVMHFPGFSVEAAELLLNREIAGIGIDTFSPDPGTAQNFPVHHLMLKHDKFQIENLNNLNLLPATGSIVFALPLKIKAGTEAPARVIAVVL